MHKLLQDTPESYYWAGFLLADGCAKRQNGIRLQLAEKDADHIKTYAKFINNNQNINKVTNNNFISYYIDFINRDVVTKFRTKFDWRDKKTHNPPTTNIIKWLDTNLFLSLLIGYIDGDGCIQYQSGRVDPKISIHIHNSWLDFVNTINNRLNLIYDYTSIKPPRMLKTGFVRYDIGCFRTIKKLKQFGLDNKLPILERKWNKIDLNRLHKFEKRDLLIEQAKNLQSQGLKLLNIALELNINYNTLCYHLYHK